MQGSDYTTADLKQKLINYLIEKLDNNVVLNADDIELAKTLLN